MTNIIKVKGACVSKTGVTLYVVGQDEIQLPASSYRTNEIMQEIKGKLARKKIAKIDLDKFSAHAQIEKRTNGFVRFFKKPVELFKNFMGQTGGILGTEKVGKDETIVALVNGKEIPGMAALERQIEHAAFTEDCIGFKIFMDRLSKVIDDRGHSVQELLNFMKKADLPIANDGTIIAYKTLSYQDKAAGVFVDVHSKSVIQRLGSRVSMPLAMVNTNRNTQCSVGLHIARRGYLKSYFGDLLTLVKVAPEDVITVPHGEPDKMRAAAYHIVAVLNKEAVALIRANKPMTADQDSAKILTDVIAGRHIGVTEEVRIGNVDKTTGEETTTPSKKKIEVEELKPKKPLPVDEPLGGGSQGLAAALDDKSASAMNIKGLNEEVAKATKEREDKKAEKKPKKAPPAKKAADPSQKPKKALTAAQINRQKALEAVKGGMSQREAVKEFKVCAKTLRKMLKE